MYFVLQNEQMATVAHIILQILQILENLPSKENYLTTAGVEVLSRMKMLQILKIHTEAGAEK